MASLSAIFKQMILSTFRSAKMTSASPGHINHFIGIENIGSEVIGSDEEIKAAILEVIQGLEIEAPEDLAEDLLDVEGKPKKKGELEGALSKGVGIAQNPTSVVASAIPLLPHATLLILAIALAPLIFDQATRPGGPLDLRFKRIIEDELNAFLSRQTQKDTEMGVRQVIIQSKVGFTAANGKNNYNTIRGIREGGLNKERLDRIGMIDHSKGVFNFG